MAAGQAPVAKIETQWEGFDVTGRGTAEKGYWVAFTTAKGAKGTVFVPRSAYSQDAVFAEVRAQAAKMDAVHGAEVPPG